MSQPVFLTFAGGVLAVATAAFAQPPAAPPVTPLAFEVASIKPAPPLDPAAIMSGKAHIGLSVDKARVDMGGMSLMALVCYAYKVKPYQIAGNPDWMSAGMNADRFDIVAKMPEAANQDQVPEMVQSLLADRFKLTLHKEKRDTPVYALIVGKGGPKLKEAEPDPAEPPKPAEAAAGGSASGATSEPKDSSKPAAPAKGEMSFGSGDNKVTMKQQSGGGMVINSKETGPVRMMPGENGAWRMVGDKMTMEMLCNMLSQYLDRPVVDQTELKGKYQVSLELTMDTLMAVARKAGMNVGAMPGAGGKPGSPADAASDPGGSSLFSSVQQLGLKLDARKLPYDYIVIDHAEKTPTEN
jgi:uncharacterized protein (TIGR03435 family)